MTLRQRLLLLGVGLPALVLAGVSIVVGQLFEEVVLRDLDERLLEQAAVESVSLFDGPAGAPHLHLAASRLADTVAQYAPRTRLYGPDGNVLLSSFEIDDGERRMLPCLAGAPVLKTVQRADGAFRQVRACVERPGEGLYTLVMEGSLAPVEEIVASLRRFELGAGGAGLVMLLALLWWQVGALVRRLRAITREAPDLGVKPIVVADAGGVGDEVDDLHRALVEASRRIAEAKDAEHRFLANAAHQLLTPLAVLSTELELAVRHPRDPEALREAITRAREDVRRMTALAKALLGFESLRVEHAEAPLALERLVSEAVTRVGAIAAGRRVVLDVELAPIEVVGSELLLVETTLNLLENAIRFSPEGGRVVVRLVHEGGDARLSIDDDGAGLPPDVKDRLFEPFARGRNSPTGSGLGLAFARGVIERHRGSIAVVNRPEHGVSVVVQLPGKTSGAGAA